jgi:hypothetical protein
MAGNLEISNFSTEELLEYEATRLLGVVGKFLHYPCRENTEVENSGI